MSESLRRYVFQPLERRGVLLGIQAGQLVAIGGAVVVALVAGPAVGGVPGTTLGVALIGATTAAALWGPAGRPLIHWAPLWVGWVVRRASGPSLSSDPLDGHAMGARPVVKWPRSALPGVELGESACSVGVITDRRHGSLVGVLPVRGRSFTLLDGSQQVQRLEGWKAVLGAVGRTGSPLRRVQWIERNQPANGSGGADWGNDAGPPTVAIEAARRSYGELIDGAAAAQMHDAWLVLSVAGRAGSSAEDALGRELRLLEGQLRNVDLLPGRPLGREDLGVLLSAAGGGRRPAATQEQWACLVADDLWHATYWVAEWPRVEVPPDFMTPLLMSTGRRTVSVTMAPIPIDRAIREARSSRTADLADAELRRRAGFLSSARREKEAEGAVRREQELADGHCEYRFSGYVTVTASDPDGLARACAETEHAAQAAHLELLRLYGRQAEAFTWTLPLARGLVS
jgi:Putative type VII ESX secretion system translocon, EccE